MEKEFYRAKNLGVKITLYPKRKDIAEIVMMVIPICKRR
jgi:hypothetical protein